MSRYTFYCSSCTLNICNYHVKETQKLIRTITQLDGVVAIEADIALKFYGPP